MCERTILNYFREKFETRKNLKVVVNRFVQKVSAIKDLDLYPGGKKVIRYKAPANKPKSQTQLPPYIPAISRYTRNKEDKTNNFVIFGDESSVEFAFTHPLVEYDQEGQIKRNYKTIAVGDRLLIWQNIDSRGQVAHLTGHIITKDGKHYSLGFGFSGKKEYKGVIPTVSTSIKDFMDDSLGLAQGVVYTPDNVFEQKLLTQCTKNGTFVRLISAVDITETHINNLNQAFDMLNTIEKATLRFTPIAGGETSDKEALIAKLNTMLLLGMYDKLYNAEVQEFITYLEQPDAKYKCIFSIGYSLIFPMMYCRFSGKKSADKTYNCASFLHNVFSDSINCGNLSYIVIDPTRCAAGSLSQMRCDNTFKIQNKQQKQELQRLEKQLLQKQERQLLQKPEPKAPKKPKPARKQQQPEQFFDTVQYL